MIVCVDVILDQIWVLDVEYLYVCMDVFKWLGLYYVYQIWMFDLVFDVFLFVGVVVIFFVVWWMCVLIVGFVVLQCIVNKWLVGEMVGKVVQELIDVFLYLYNFGVLWLEQFINQILDLLCCFLLCQFFGLEIFEGVEYQLQ